ncbi:hypothetical protein BVRB_1g007330 [Beta vulgaris subsp. vulgaris]|nr:hypothetical protein BVRB_1g007330 [Beta vulgaris subsp. vulgaris]
MIKYQGFWYYLDSETPKFRNVLTFQKHFVAQDTDIFVTSLPKTGTTWLKSLLFAIINRLKYPIDQNPLLTHHPQELVYNLESGVYGEALAYPHPCHLKELLSPRVFGTHIPYTCLPESIKTSECRILYICRNPLDTLVSRYYFIPQYAKITKEDDLVPNGFENFFEDYFDGKCLFGPFFEHVLEYWKLSLEQPNKVLFLKYEDLKDDPTYQLKRVAEFIGMPFSIQEESEGVIKQIIELCNIKNMKELEVNKSGVVGKYFEKKSFFRKGEVGDWTNHFTPNMVERMKKLMEDKLEGTGLSFKLLPN